MAINFPGPYAVEINYTTYYGGLGLPHKMLLSVELQTDPIVGALFSAISVVLNDGGFAPLDVAVNGYLTQLQPRFLTTTTFDFIDLWKYEPLSFDRSFISSYTPTVTAGSSVAATSYAQYEMYTFRTAEGGVARITLLETTDVAVDQDGYAGLAANQKAIVDFILAPTTGFFLARDTSRFVSFIRKSSGQNEALFRRRFR